MHIVQANMIFLSHLAEVLNVVLVVNVWEELLNYCLNAGALVAGKVPSIFQSMFSMDWIVLLYLILMPDF